MMIMLRRWKIEVYFALVSHVTTLFISDNHYCNVLRKLSEIDFMHEPTSVKISLDNDSQLNSGSING